MNNNFNTPFLIVIYLNSQNILRRQVFVCQKIITLLFFFIINSHALFLISDVAVPHCNFNDKSLFSSVNNLGT